MPHRHVQAVPDHTGRQGSGDPRPLTRLNAAAMDMDIDPFYGAPELLVMLANKAMPTYTYDGSLVMGNMMNAAADLGVAS